MSQAFLRKSISVGENSWYNDPEARAYLSGMSNKTTPEKMGDGRSQLKLYWGKYFKISISLAIFSISFYVLSKEDHTNFHYSI